MPSGYRDNFRGVAEFSGETGASTPSRVGGRSAERRVSKAKHAEARRERGVTRRLQKRGNSVKESLVQ